MATPRSIGHPEAQVGDEFDEEDDNGTPVTSVPNELLNTDPAIGLTSEQVEERLFVYGKNVLEDIHTPWYKKLLKNFVNPIAVLIELAIVLTAVLGNYIDVAVLSVLLLLNAFVHFYHENKTENIIEALKSSLALQATVVRDGERKEIMAEYLVPGDVVFLQTGDVVPADAKVIGDNVYLQVDQSTTTGESLAVEKRGRDTVFASSGVKRGEGWAIVIATGKMTLVGKTSQLVKFTKVSDSYQRVLSVINNFILVSDFVVCFVIFTIALFRGLEVIVLVEFLVILTVASLPIALPAVLTVTLALGAQKLAKKKAIVRRLACIEALAGVDVLCSDKTGTLTYNTLTIHPPYVLTHVDLNEEEDDDDDDAKLAAELPFIKDLILTAALASERHEDPRRMDAIDKAIFDAFRTYHIPMTELDKWKVGEFKPFDPVTKRIEAKVTNRQTGQVMTVTKGAPQVIIALSGLSSDHIVRKRYERIVDVFAQRGFRSLGVARKYNGEWTVLGVIPMFDPPRRDSQKTLEGAQKLGIRIKMLTGDALAIAKETASRLGMGSNIYDTTYLGLDQEIDPHTEEADKIDKADGFSQIFPEHKYNIVDVLQKRGHVVAVSGDGQNDSAALKKADVGIAVSGAVDSARSAASIVFLRPGLYVILDAIKLSRQIFVRMYGYALYRIAHSLHILLIAAVLYATFNVIFPNELLIFLAIFSDLSVLLIGFDNAISGPKPERWNLRHTIAVSTTIAVLLTLGSVTWYMILLTQGLGQDIVLSLMFLQIALTENQLIFSTRVRKPFFHTPRPSVWLFITVLAVDIVATVFVWLGVIVPASASGIWILKAWLYSIAVFLIVDITKSSLRNVQIHVHKVAKSAHSSSEFYKVKP